MTTRTRTLILACVLFFLSGALGLAYELIWIRKAALVVGASQIALSTVLTAFFLGLGLGSLFVGRRLRSRRRSPLFVYGLFELGIGLFALSFPALFELIEKLYGVFYPLAAGSAPLLFALRFALLFLLFLPPTFLMGGTLPLLLDALVEHDRTLGSRASFLYGLNILGAVAGVLVTSYLAIPSLGMNGTSYAGGIGNLALGLTAVIAFRRLAPVHAETERGRAGLFYCAAAFAAGVVAIGYQVAWARYFTLFQTTTVYITAVLLAVYLLALAAGSFLLAPLLAARLAPLRIAATLQALAPLAALWGLELWARADYRPSLLGQKNADGSITAVETLELNHDYERYWHFWSEAADATFFAPLFQTALVLFVPVALFGATLPALIAAASARSAALRATSGSLVFWNTLGSSLGGFAAGYVLLPFLGLHRTFVALAAGSLGIGAALSFMAWRLPVAVESGRSALRRRRSVAEGPLARSRWGLELGLVVLALAACGVVAFAIAKGDVTTHTIRRWGYGRDPGGEKMPLVEVVEGPLNATFVFEDENSLQVGSGNVALAVTYKKDFSTQAIQGHVPALFWPGKGRPQDCLGICLGSGQSFGALLMYPEVRRLDVVDISTEIVEVSLRRFKPYQHGLGDVLNPRVTFHLDDGRHFVERAADASYDVISMEPPPPAAEGVWGLYSREFYEDCRRVLRSPGIFMQWLPLYRVTPLDAKGIIQTQAAVFPESFVVKVGRDDFMVVSYKERPQFDLDAIRERCKVFEAERLVQGKRWEAGCRHHIASLEGVLSLLLMGPNDAGALGAPVLYDDDRQQLGYSSGDRRLLRLYEGPALSRVSFSALKLTSFVDLQGYFLPALSKELANALAQERAASLAFYRVPDPQRLEETLKAFQKESSGLRKAELALAVAQAVDGPLDKADAFVWLENALVAHPTVSSQQAVAVARGIARNHLAIFADLVKERVDRLAQRFPLSPLVQVMRQELQAYLERQRKGQRYLFP